MIIVTTKYDVEFGEMVRVTRPGVVSYFAPEFNEGVWLQWLEDLPVPTDDAVVFPEQPEIHLVTWRFLPDELVYWAQAYKFTTDEILALDTAFPLVLHLVNGRKDWFDATVDKYNKAGASSGSVQSATDS